LQLGTVGRERSPIQAPLNTLVDTIGEGIHPRVASAVLGIDCGKTDERSSVRIQPAVEMTVGAVEAITDIGSGILLCIDDNVIAKPYLFTKLTPWNGFRGGGGEFYRRIAGLVSPTKFLSLDPSTLA
jgi:hypothetical protein